MKSTQPPRLFATMATFVRAFRPHPDKTIASPDVAFGATADIPQGVFTIASSRGSDTYHYFTTDLDALPALYEAKKDLHFDLFYWMPWTSDQALWTSLRPRAPIQRVIPSLIKAAAPSNHPPSRKGNEKQPIDGGRVSINGNDDDKDDCHDSGEQQDGDHVQPKEDGATNYLAADSQQQTKARDKPPSPHFRPPQFNDYGPPPGQQDFAPAQYWQQQQQFGMHKPPYIPPPPHIYGYPPVPSSTPPQSPLEQQQQFDT